MLGILEISSNFEGNITKLNKFESNFPILEIPKTTCHENLDPDIDTTQGICPRYSNWNPDM